MTKNNVASFHWTSPELLAAEEFSRNTDIWQAEFNGFRAYGGIDFMSLHEFQVCKL